VDRHGLRPRDDRLWKKWSVLFSYNTLFVIASWTTVRRGNPSCPVRFLEHSGSPRATPSRWQDA